MRWQFYDCIKVMKYGIKIIHAMLLLFIEESFQPQLGSVVVVIVWYLDLQPPVQSVSINTKVVSSNLVNGEMYSIYHDVIKFVSGLRQVDGFLH
jgi:hypothetical protein